MKSEEKSKEKSKEEKKNMPEKKEEDLFAEKKITVNKKEIPENIQAEVADMCLNAEDIKNPEKYADIATKLKKKLDKKFGDGWNVIIGDNFSGSCSVAKNNFLEISIANVRVLVFKSSAHVSSESGK
ncbi:dynein light chain LC8-type [Nematocida minor]|uniref:dynein light chain LC8-type n=1 Tax=Nematocida minor TaxID=1912983 RepID=UPI002220B188|nr:dynein light chain LC8-type [Nematocida minor]KAI5190841.1 dynein light chain LC8-type [Nematocida minor]